MWTVGGCGSAGAVSPPRAEAERACAPARTATGFGRVPGGLSLARLRAHPHGIDLGPLEPRLPEILRTLSGNELCPEPIAAELRRLAEAPAPESDGEFVVGLETVAYRRPGRCPLGGQDHEA